MNLRKESAKALGAFLAELVPSLKARFVVGQPDPEKDATYNGLAILPGRFSFEGQQDEELDESQVGTTLVEVGSLSGTVELRIYARTAAERDDLEQQVTEAMLSREGSPGTVVVTLANLSSGGLRWGYEPPCTFALDSVDWEDEFAFDKRRYGFVSLNAWLPVLLTRTGDGATTIDTMILALTDDLTTDNASELVLEAYRVGADGSVALAS
jgi:hypothetical protein